MEKHSQLVRHLGLEKSCGELTAPWCTADLLAEYLTVFSLVLIKIIVGYIHLRVDSVEDLDEMYDRLLWSQVSVPYPLLPGGRDEK